MPPFVVTIAGSDPSGGAGLQGDLKTFHQHAVAGAAVVTLLTVQSTEGVERVELLPPALVAEQLEVVLDDLRPAAVKTGALGSGATVEGVARALAGREIPLVVDPVWSPSRGSALGDASVASAIWEALVPLATLVTPNTEEGARLTGLPVASSLDAERAAARIVEQGAQAALITGGHLCGADRGVDLLHDGTRITRLQPAEPFDGDAHGTGCALSAAIASRLALGEPLARAVVGAKTWLEGALRSAIRAGRGAPTINHLWPVQEKP